MANFPECDVIRGVGGKVLFGNFVLCANREEKHETRQKFVYGLRTELLLEFFTSFDVQGTWKALKMYNFLEYCRLLFLKTPIFGSSLKNRFVQGLVILHTDTIRRTSLS